MLFMIALRIPYFSKTSTFSFLQDFLRPLYSFSTRFYTMDMQYVAVNNWFIRERASSRYEAGGKFGEHDLHLALE